MHMYSTLCMDFIRLVPTTLTLYVGRYLVASEAAVLANKKMEIGAGMVMVLWRGIYS